MDEYNFSLFSEWSVRVEHDHWFSTSVGTGVSSTIILKVLIIRVAWDYSCTKTIGMIQSFWILKRKTQKMNSYKYWRVNVNLLNTVRTPPLSLIIKPCQYFRERSALNHHWNNQVALAFPTTFYDTSLFEVL